MQNSSLGTCCEIALRWMPQYLINEKSILFRQWLGAVRQQAITWTNIDLDLCHHMASQDHNELIRFEVMNDQELSWPLTY